MVDVVSDVVLDRREVVRRDVFGMSRTQPYGNAPEGRQTNAESHVRWVAAGWRWPPLAAPCNGARATGPEGGDAGACCA
jgi:hypothetical protein